MEKSQHLGKAIENARAAQAKEPFNTVGEQIEYLAKAVEHLAEAIRQDK